MAAVKVLQARDDRPGSRLMAPLPPRYDNERRVTRPTDPTPENSADVVRLSVQSLAHFCFKKKNKKNCFSFFKKKIDFDWTSS